jgi:hypothetical protein
MYKNLIIRKIINASLAFLISTHTISAMEYNFSEDVPGYSQERLRELGVVYRSALDEIQWVLKNYDRIKRLTYKPGGDLDLLNDALHHMGITEVIDEAQIEKDKKGHRNILFAENYVFKIFISPVEHTTYIEKIIDSHRRLKQISDYLQGHPPAGFKICLPYIFHLQQAYQLVGGMQVANRLRSAIDLESVVLRMIYGEEMPAATKLLKFLGNAVGYFQSSGCISQGNAFIVNVHGDMKADNIIVQGSPTTSPVFHLIDNGTFHWAVVDNPVGSPLTDPVYFACCSALLAYKKKEWQGNYDKGLENMLTPFYSGYLQKISMGMAYYLKGFYLDDPGSMIKVVRGEERNLGITMMGDDHFNKIIRGPLSRAFEKSFNEIYGDR